MTIRVTGSTDSGYLYEFDMPPSNWKLPVGFGIKMSAYPGRDCEVVDTQKENARPWAGEGLPPVGTVCEVQDLVNGSTPFWRETKIIAHHLGFAIETSSADGDDVEIGVCAAGDFRPIRTPEQIAAEEREMVVADMWVTVKQKLGDEVEANYSYTRDVLRALHDAGYHKVTP